MTKLSAAFLSLSLLSVSVFPLLGFAQDEPTPQPKPRPSVPASRPTAKAAPTGGPTLLVTCDLACVLKIDGQRKGEIEADGSLKVRVELGQHIVTAATTDGKDKVRQEVKVEKAEQTLLELKLSSVRTTRLQQEQQARDEATRAQKLREEQERAAEEQEQQRRAQEEQAKREQADAARGYWTDPSTSLMWTKKDNGDLNDLTWQQAMDYCRNLRLAGHSDWRLPAIEELQAIYDKDISTPGPCCNGRFSGNWHVKGSLQLSGFHWSSLQIDPRAAWDFDFYDGGRYSNPLGNSYGRRALCVRSSGE